QAGCQPIEARNGTWAFACGGGDGTAWRLAGAVDHQPPERRSAWSYRHHGVSAAGVLIRMGRREDALGETTSYLKDVAADVIRPLNQSEAKAVAAVLKDIGKQEPAVGELMAGESALKQFLIAALTLSPYLRDTAAISPQLVATAILEPVEA